MRILNVIQVLLFILMLGHQTWTLVWNFPPSYCHKELGTGYSYYQNNPLQKPLTPRCIFNAPWETDSDSHTRPTNRYIYPASQCLVIKATNTSTLVCAFPPVRDQLESILKSHLEQPNAIDFIDFDCEQNEDDIKGGPSCWCLPLHSLDYYSDIHCNINELHQQWKRCTNVIVRANSVAHLLKLQTIRLSNVKTTAELLSILVSGRFPEIMDIRLKGVTIQGNIATFYVIPRKLDALILVGIPLGTEFHISSSYSSSVGQTYQPCTLRRLAIIASNIEKFQKDRLICNSETLTELSLAYNYLSDLDTEAFWGMGSMIILDLCHNIIRSLPDGLFKDNILIQQLFLGHNQLSDIPNSIRTLKDVHVLHFEFNQIKYITEYAFQNARSLEHLNLAGNQIISIEPKSFFNCLLLNELNLTHNNLQRLEDIAEAVNGDSLENLFLSHNNITALFPKFYANRNITLLLDNNAITQLNISIFTDNDTHSMKRQHRWPILDLSSNPVIQDTGFYHCEIQLSFNIGLILMSNNLSNLKTLSLSINWSQVSLICLDKNIFTVLDDTKVPLMQNVRSLSIVNNRVSYVYPGLYLLLPSLSDLNLSNNFIKYLSLDDYSYISINVASNPLSGTQPIDYGMRFGDLNMENCSLTEVPSKLHRTFDTQVTFNQNNIQEFHNFTDANRVTFFQNPIRCSCRMVWLRHSPDLRKQYLFDSCLDVIQDVTKWFEDVPLENFLCAIEDITICDTHCTCLGPSETQDIHPTYAKCRKQNLTSVPQLIPSSVNTIDLRDNNIHLLYFPTLGHIRQTKVIFLQKSNIAVISDSTFTEMSMLQEVYLDFNRIEVLHMEVFNSLINLRKLSISHNLITHIIVPDISPISLTNLLKFNLKDNKFVDLTQNARTYIKLLPKVRSLLLSGKPWWWQCDRQRAELKSWMFSMSGRIIDMDEIPCFALKRNIECHKHFQNEAHFYKKLSQRIWISGGVVLGIAILELFIYKYRKTIKIYLVYLFPCLKCCREDCDSLYDVFVAYDHQDNNVRTWVITTLLPQLESGCRGWGYKAFVMERDTRPGTDHSAAIRAAVRTCRSMILIINQTYAANPWLYQAFREGECFALEEGKFRLIIILHDVDINAAISMDEVLAKYIECKKYLIHSNRSFWQELFFLLPRKMARSNERRESTEQSFELQPFEDCILQYRNQV